MTWSRPQLVMTFSSRVIYLQVAEHIVRWVTRGVAVGATGPATLSESVLFFFYGRFDVQMLLLIPGVGNQGGCGSRVRQAFGRQRLVDYVNVGSGLFYSRNGDEDFRQSTLCALKQSAESLAVES